MSRNEAQHSDASLAIAPRMALAKEAAMRLSVSPSMLRKLTLAGEIGHVRLGTGSQRQRIGYTEAQIEQFIASRTVPAAPRAAADHDQRPVRSRRRAAATASDAGAAASSLITAALKRGSVTEWGASS